MFLYEVSTLLKFPLINSFAIAFKVSNPNNFLFSEVIGIAVTDFFLISSYAFSMLTFSLAQKFL